MRMFLITPIILATQNQNPESSSGYFSGIQLFVFFLNADI